MLSFATFGDPEVYEGEDYLALKQNYLMCFKIGQSIQLFFIIITDNSPGGAPEYFLAISLDLFEYSVFLTRNNCLRYSFLYPQNSCLLLVSIKHCNRASTGGVLLSFLHLLMLLSPGLYNKLDIWRGLLSLPSTRGLFLAQSSSQALCCTHKSKVLGQEKTLPHRGDVYWKEWKLDHILKRMCLCSQKSKGFQFMVGRIN